MKINEFIEKFKNAKVQNTKVNPNAVSEYLQKELEIKSYIPFRDKRKIAEMIVEQNIDEKDGIKKYDSINAYIGLVASAISTHTNLEFGADPVADYDLLAESGLLPKIISEFQQDDNECDVVLKMALAMELEDNNVNDGILFVYNTSYEETTKVDIKKHPQWGVFLLWLLHLEVSGIKPDDLTTSPPRHSAYGS